MATSTIQIPKNTWTLISEVSVRFQVQGQTPLIIIESVALPTDLDIRKVAFAGGMYTFIKVDGDFYAYSKDTNNEISIEPVEAT